MLDDFFWATLGFIFLSGVVSAFVRLRNKDDCLKLIHDQFVTITRTDGSTVWGDLEVFSNGVQLNYLKPHRTRRGLTKSGYMMYAADMAHILVLARYVGQLSPEEMRVRRKQIEATFQPGLIRQIGRWWRNTFDTLRDAFVKAFSLLLGQVVKTSGSQALSGQSKQLDSTGKALLSSSADAYEPMLEAHIGRSVILEVLPPGGGDERLEISGYLAEYSDAYIAVFNGEHGSGERHELLISSEGDLPSLKGIRLERVDGHLRVVNESDEFLVLESVQPVDGSARRLGATLVKGSALLIGLDSENVTLAIQWVTCVDVVCPRSVAQVRYVGPRGFDTQGAFDDEAVAPAHFDERSDFP